MGFAGAGGACAMTMFLAESGDGSAAPSATRVSFALKAGAMAEFASAGTETLQVVCAGDGSSVEIHKGNANTQ